MGGAILIPIILGLIFLARSKLGNASYNNFVLTVFKWWIIASVAAFACLYVYSHFIR
jgi:hypothetical protein